MRYRKCVPPTDRVWSAILCSIPFMILNFAITILLVPTIRNWIPIPAIQDSIEISFTINMTLIVYLAIFMVVLIIHEFLHGAFIPNFLKSEVTYWGITPFGGFVSTSEELTKFRFITIGIIPFIVLSIIIPNVLEIFNILNGFVAFLALTNALGSSVDMLNVLLILIQVPKNGRIINNGSETYYKSIE